MSFLFRSHRGSFDDSMETVKEFEDREKFLEFLKEEMKHWPCPFDGHLVQVEPYCIFDERNNWSTYIVTMEGYGVLGFTDGCVEPNG